MKRPHIVAAVLTGALMLASCGGEDAPPPPTSTPAPTPTPTASPPPAADVSAAPRNPFLAGSSWPIFHANSYATASARIGPGPVQEAQIIGSLTSLIAPVYVSPWTVMGPIYGDGSQPVITTPNNGVAKYLINGDDFRAIDFLPLNRDPLDFDWGLLLLANGNAVVSERLTNSIAIVGDIDPANPTSDLEVKRRIAVNRNLYGNLLAHHSVAFDGTLIALTDANQLIAIDLDQGQVISNFELPGDSGASFQNSFPIDQNGRIFVAAQNLTVAVDWTGRAFRRAWEAPYDMRGPGCEDVPPDRSREEEILAVANGETCTGTGTTPTLIGGDSDVMVIVDGHSPKNNLVAFWRGAIPADWSALPDPNKAGEFLDRRVAGVFALPYSTPDGDGFTAQNSPAVFDTAIVAAQWAGFQPGANAPRGVQRVDWLPNLRRFRLVWANPSILFNGVPTISCVRSDCHTYGMGRYGNRYQYTSIDLETGEESGRVDLGIDPNVLDQGNNHALADDGSIVYSGRRTMIRVR
ncbi:hypothetical protein CD351_04760 [Erythrobacter sp. KY5]|uniref:hypothetical protein n=1 Tax=Erythrobacter sp. KY5 TaxID=2011159 RepID=UPI000DBEF3CB|nr:hypothetical protein [Erythrobacter sp. KY5]AWW73732.1 hypothetical protein CD351_04760 [Erythrobacter sp. KY5]